VAVDALCPDFGAKGHIPSAGFHLMAAQAMSRECVRILLFLMNVVTRRTGHPA
jgi:hypothetical protein